RRLTLIEKDLDSVESNIERLKTNNQGIDLATSGEMYLNESRQFQNEKQKIETDIKLAQMMRDYMRTAEREKDLIPNNTGLVDANIETQINEYNTLLLKKNRLEEGSSIENPIVIELNRELNSMRSNINRAVDNATEGLRIKL